MYQENSVLALKFKWFTCFIVNIYFAVFSYTTKLHINIKYVFTSSSIVACFSSGDPRQWVDAHLDNNVFDGFKMPLISEQSGSVIRISS